MKEKGWLVYLQNIFKNNLFIWKLSYGLIYLVSYFSQFPLECYYPWCYLDIKKG